MTQEGGPAFRPQSPGDLRPRSAPLLDRAPGERFATAQPTPPPIERPALGRALGAGAAGVLAVVLAWLILAGILGLDWGMLVAAVAGGWTIGTLVALGAWARRRHVGGWRVRLVASALGATAWVGGQAIVYLWTRVTLPGSELDLAGRISATPFTDYLGQILGPLDALNLVALIAVSWLSAR